MARRNAWASRFPRATAAPFSPHTGTVADAHIMQMKQPGNGTSPVVVQSLRRVNGRRTIELKSAVDDILAGRTDLEPLHDRWTDVDFRIKVGNGSAGSVHWILKSGGATVVDASKTDVGAFPADRVRPKWGIHRSLEDASGSLQDTCLLLTALRGYRLGWRSRPPSPQPFPAHAQRKPVRVRGHDQAGCPPWPPRATAPGPTGDSAWPTAIRTGSPPGEGKWP